MLQPRIDALLEASPSQDAFDISIEYDGDRKQNVVSITIDEDLYFTLDNFGFLDNLEDARLAMDRKSNPNATRVYLDPKIKYPFMSFDAGPVGLHNWNTDHIRAQVDPATPRITLTVSLLTHNTTLDVHLAGFNFNAVEVKHAVVTLDLVISASDTAGLTLGVVVRPLDFQYNFKELPDPDINEALRTQLQAGLTNLLSGNVLQPIFTTLMGGKFTFRNVTTNSGAWEFRFVAGAEEPPHVVSPFYSARGEVAPGTAPSFASPHLDKIDHIVVLMMENRSFDHVLGHLSLGGRGDVDGLTPALIAAFPEANRPFELTETRLPFDPDHSFDQVAVQMGGDLASHELMHGFVLSFLEKYPFMAFEPGSPQRKAQDDPYWYPSRTHYRANAVLGYHSAKNLPVYDYLARQYMICDRWHASHPGPTFPNRFYYLSGHLNTDGSGEPERDNNTDSLRLLRGRTIQDVLTERNISWKMYESPPDVCMLRMYARHAFDDTNIRPMDEFFAAARAGALPSVTFLEPNYHIGKQTNDDHPPSDMAQGQHFVDTVYSALTANPAAWNKTLFIITYDEHGGLYDHRVPQLADRYSKPGAPPLDIGYGVRVPAFIISPWVPGGVTTRAVTPAAFDHTSILKTIINRFAPRDPAILSDRMAFANDLFPLLTLDAPRVVKPRLPDLSHFGDLTSVHVGGTISVAPSAVPVRPPVATPPVVSIASARRAMLAEAREQRAPIMRQSALFQGKVDWHQYMTRLALMVK